MADINEGYGTNWPAEFIQEVLDEYSGNRVIESAVGSDALLQLLEQEMNEMLWGLPLQVKQLADRIGEKVDVWKQREDLLALSKRALRRKNLYIEALGITCSVDAAATT